MPSYIPKYHEYQNDESQINNKGHTDQQDMAGITPVHINGFQLDSTQITPVPTSSRNLLKCYCPHLKLRFAKPMPSLTTRGGQAQVIVFYCIK